MLMGIKYIFIWIIWSLMSFFAWNTQAVQIEMSIFKFVALKSFFISAKHFLQFVKFDYHYHYIISKISYYYFRHPFHTTRKESCVSNEYRR